MSKASVTYLPFGTGLVGGAIAMAILDLLLQKNVLTLDDVQGALKTAQGSLMNSPAVAGSVEGARIIEEIVEQFATRWRKQQAFHNNLV
jgi:hypothetical protein